MDPFNKIINIKNQKEEVNKVVSLLTKKLQIAQEYLECHANTTVLGKNSPEYVRNQDFLKEVYD